MYNKDYFETDKWHPYGYVPDPVQVYLWEWAKAHILNPLRCHVNAPLVVTSAIRVMEDYERLIAEGKHPSPTSDHFARTPVKTITVEDANKYGDFYRFSTFAVDIDGLVDLRELARHAYLTIERLIPRTDHRFVNGLVDVKQLIYESHSSESGTVDWIHVSVPREAVFNQNVAGVINGIERDIKYLEARDGEFFLSTFS